VTAPFRYDGRVALVTGAGGGLGRTHALLLAARGAKVVVNDLGSGPAGGGVDIGPAQKVVNEITAAGGEAAANTDSVTEGHRLVEATLDRFGRIDILINNAGVLRDKSFTNMEVRDFQFVLDVHLVGSVKVTKACWWLKDNGRPGVIVMTSSTSGLYGNFGQTNYGAAKLGLVGFMNTLKLEGQKDNIKVNSLAPVAGTRMTENLMPPQALEALKPEYVTPGVIYLVSEDAPNGVILAAGGGAFAVAQIVEANGAFLGHNDLTAEKVAENWGKISDMTGAKAYFMGGEQTQKFFARISGT